MPCYVRFGLWEKSWFFTCIIFHDNITKRSKWRFQEDNSLLKVSHLWLMWAAPTEYRGGKVMNWFNGALMIIKCRSCGKLYPIAQRSPTAWGTLRNWIAANTIRIASGLIPGRCHGFINVADLQMVDWQLIEISVGSIWGDCLKTHLLNLI